MSMPQPIKLEAAINLDHIALQAELLVHEIRAASKDRRLEQRDIDQLHEMVRCCILFLDPSTATRPGD